MRETKVVDVPQRRLADIVERPVAPVAIQAVWKPAIGLRRAIVASAGLVGTHSRVVEVVVDVVTNIEIEPAITVVVDERR